MYHATEKAGNAAIGSVLGKNVFLKIAALTVAIGETALRILEIYLLRGPFFSKASSFLPDV